MSFTEIVDLECSKSTALGGTDRRTGKPNPTQLEGYFIGTRQVASAKSKSGFCSLHIFQTKDGNVGVWGKTNLDQKLTSVTPGTMTRVSYVGMVETKNNPMYKYKVETDKHNLIDVGSANGTVSEGTSSYGDGDEGEDTGAFEDEAPADETPPPRAARPATTARTPDAASQARVKELLNSRTKALR